MKYGRVWKGRIPRIQTYGCKKGWAMKDTRTARITLEKHIYVVLQNTALRKIGIPARVYYFENSVRGTLVLNLVKFWTVTVVTVIRVVHMSWYYMIFLVRKRRCLNRTSRLASGFKIRGGRGGSRARLIETA
jgi:hypothetical protein